LTTSDDSSELTDDELPPEVEAPQVTTDPSDFNNANANGLEKMFTSVTFILPYNWLHTGVVSPPLSELPQETM
jgi:hypothetical protein